MTTAQILDFNTHATHAASVKSSSATILEQLKVLDSCGHEPLNIPQLEQEKKVIARVYSDSESKAETDIVDYVTAKFEVAQAQFVGQINQAVKTASIESGRLEKELQSLEATHQKEPKVIGDPTQAKPLKYTAYKIIGLVVLQIAVASCIVATNTSLFNFEMLMVDAKNNAESANGEQP